MTDPLRGDANQAINASGTGAPDDDLIVLRDLPGIQKIEDLCYGRGAWLTEAEIAERADPVSLSVFGIAAGDTYGPCGGPAATPEVWAVRDRRPLDWEDAFALPAEDWSDGAIIGWWYDFGFDVADQANEKPLRCLPLFARQLICVADEMMPEAKLHLQGGGGVEAAAERWGERLAEEARLFKRK